MVVLVIAVGVVERQLQWSGGGTGNLGGMVVVVVRIVALEWWW